VSDDLEKGTCDFELRLHAPQDNCRGWEPTKAKEVVGDLAARNKTLVNSIANYKKRNAALRREIESLRGAPVEPVPPQGKDVFLGTTDEAETQPGVWEWVPAPRLYKAEAQLRELQALVEPVPALMSDLETINANLRRQVDEARKSAPVPAPRLEHVLEAIEAKREDSEFMARIKDSVERHKPLLDKLAAPRLDEAILFAENNQRFFARTGQHSVSQEFETLKNILLRSAPPVGTQPKGN
jgi:chaperonin cofactor prefoldin